jgi:cellulose synthase/poly-beta-1,6-N-acetylglucosamine synthase-like glycosyltransferase
VTLIHIPVANKTAQINAAVAASTAEWLLLTDADARLPARVLQTMIATALTRPSIGAVGSAVEPESAHPLERRHWRMLNAMRLRESESFQTTVLSGSCLLFHRSVVGVLPDDVTADDMYLPLAAALSGRLVACVPDTVIDQRSPIWLVDLFWHKERKARACLKEALRFWPERHRMAAVSRPFLFWRLVQLAAMPCLLALGLVFGSIWFVQTLGPLNAGIALVCLAALAFAGRRVPALRPLWEAVALCVLLWAVLLTALARYPWAELSAAIPRLVTRAPVGAK